MEDTLEYIPQQIVGLSTANVMRGAMTERLRLVSKFITTKCGAVYVEESRGVFVQLPLYADIKNPVTMVSNI